MTLQRGASLLVLLVKRLSTELQQHNFKRKKSTLYKEMSGNLILIHFQKSKFSKTESCLFTVDIGIVSRRILQFHNSETTPESPEIEDCHWRKRIGFFGNDKHDKWWELNSMEDVTAVAADVLQAITTKALPEVYRYASDASLRDLWLSDISPGLTEIQRLLSLSILLKIIGPREILPKLIDRLKSIAEGRPSWATVKLHISKLEIIDTDGRS